MPTYRAFNTPAGWLWALHVTDGPNATPPEAHVADLAAALGIDPSTIEVVEAETDPRTGTLIEPPPAPAAPPEPHEALAERIRGASTLAQLKAALLGEDETATAAVAARPR
jgi:hypothetical protein